MAPAVPSRLKGICKALYCLDVARGIDLRRAEASLTSTRRTAFQHKSRFPEGAGMSPPLRTPWETPPEDLGGRTTGGTVEIALFDMGALCITWDVPFDGTLEELVALSALLYDHAGLTRRSRELATEIAAACGVALERPRLAPYVEDYTIFEVEPLEGGPAALLDGARHELARVLRAEDDELSEQEVEDALAHPVSYGAVDVCLVDWLAALLMGRDMEDERLVLEIANVELLELRLLDSQLQIETEEAYELLARPRGLLSAFTAQRRELEQIARIQADEALLHEGIDNALKLFGDDYLARLYRKSAARFHFADWDLSIERKLAVLRNIYQSLADVASHRRSEALEWIIIALIAVDIVLYFTPFR